MRITSVVLFQLCVPLSQCYILPFSSRLSHISSTATSSTKRQIALAPLSSESSTDPQQNDKTPVAPRKNKRPYSRPGSSAIDIPFLQKRTADLLNLTNTAIPQPHPPKIKINKRSFNWLIDAWAFSGAPDAAQHALTLLHRMESYPGVSPDVRSYTKVINALSRSGLSTSGQKAEEILDRMTELAASGDNPTAKPNTYTYTGAIEAWTNSNKGAEGARRAEALSEKMESLSVDDDDVKPTARSFNAVISAWAKSGEAYSAERAEDTLEKMEKLYSSGGDPDVKPNAFNYNAVMNAWAQNGEGASAVVQIEGIFERMKILYSEGDEGMRPTSASYNTVISAWAKVGNAARAEELLWEMEREFERTGDGIIKPNVKTFNSVLNAWAKSREENAAHRAEQILTNMTALADTNPALTPDVTSYSTVINAWARSHNFGKAIRARNILELMATSTSPKARPNTIIYNSVMNACAFTIGDEGEQGQAMAIAHEIYKELGESPYGSPDEVTYGTLLKVCVNQMAHDDARMRIAHAVFKKCSEKGMVGELVLQQLKILVDEEVFREITGMGKRECGVDNLPIEWTCNVRRRRRR